MKKIILLALCGYAAWSYFKTSESSKAVYVEENMTMPEPIVTKPMVNYTCDGRQYCSQMSSKEEAVFFINNCPNTKMDGDNDGVPCEKQFGYY